MGIFLIVAGLVVAAVAVARLFRRARWAHIRNRGLAALLLIAGLLVAFAGIGVAAGPSQNTPSVARSPTRASSAPVRPSSHAPAPSPTAFSPSESPSPPESPSPTQSPSPSLSPTGSLNEQGGVALPDHRLTPGAAFPGVAAAQVCTEGWAEAHRDVPEDVRYAVFAEYGIPYSAHDSYEVDHLIPLELGGSNSIRNLWPQPEGGSAPSSHAKDALEDRLHELVCDGNLALATAQHAIAANWWTAYQAYVQSPPPAEPSSSAPPAPPPSPSSSPTSGLPVVHPGAFCSRAQAGKYGVTSAGTLMICKTTPTDSRLRWRAA